MDVSQLPLFPTESYEAPPDATAAAPPLISSSLLSSAVEAFHNHMIHRGFTENTIKAFLADLRLFVKHVGPDTHLASIATEDLNSFLTYLREDRGVPCTPRSSARRLTTLRVFFGWLTKEGILLGDPAASIVHERAKSPLPEILTDGQVKRLLAATRTLMIDQKRPDARPHLLITLLLDTGLKKSECMSAMLSDVNASDPTCPVIHVRYDDPKKTHKERTLALPLEFSTTLEQYVREYRPQERLFECTPRNLEYVLAAAAQLAGLQGVSFEGLRLACAVRDYRAGMPSDKLHRKLGLSIITWRDKVKQIEALASAPS